ncbi:TPA: hypothetical protein BOS_20774 [Bos taurus]|nr:TPA: hypothetical protein BOS_20774 [Bos taurus]
MEVFGHELLFDIIQRPLVIRQFQSFPLLYLKSFVGVCGHGHGCASHLLLHHP